MRKVKRFIYQEWIWITLGIILPRSGISDGTESVRISHTLTATPILLNAVMAFIPLRMMKFFTSSRNRRGRYSSWFSMPELIEICGEQLQKA